MNRSIQVEGSFRDLKQDSRFRRFLYHGMVNEKAENTLLALAHNIQKLHRKIQQGRTGTHLFPTKKMRKKSIKKTSKSSDFSRAGSVKVWRKYNKSIKVFSGESYNLKNGAAKP